MRSLRAVIVYFKTPKTNNNRIRGIEGSIFFYCWAQHVHGDCYDEKHVHDLN